MVDNACKYAISNVPKTLEDIFFVSSIKAAYSKICEVGDLYSGMGTTFEILAFLIVDQNHSRSTENRTESSGRKP